MEGTAATATAVEEPVLSVAEGPYLYRFVRVIRDDRDRADPCPAAVHSIELETLKEWCGLQPDEDIPEKLFTEYLMPLAEVPWQQPEPHGVLFVMPRGRPQDVRFHLFFMVHDVELDQDGVFVDVLALPVSLWIPGSFLHEHMKKAFQAAGISPDYLSPPDNPALRQRVVQAEKRLRDKEKGFGKPPPEGQVKPWAVEKVGGK